MRFNTPFEKYVDPSEQLPDQVVIEPGVIAHGELPPDVETHTSVRRMRLSPGDFIVHGYTAGCAGCTALRRKTGQNKNHSEECRLRMEQCLTATAEGRGRKEREAARREDELTTALKAEDDRITKEKDINDKAAKDSAEATNSTEPRPKSTDPSIAKGGPAADDDMFITDRMPVDIDDQDSRTSPTTIAKKKSKPMSDWDDRAPAQRRSISDPDDGSDPKRPHVPAPSSPTVSYKSDEPEDVEMEDKKI